MCFNVKAKIIEMSVLPTPLSIIEAIENQKEVYHRPM
jgi:hypothetical protein